MLLLISTLAAAGGPALEVGGSCPGTVELAATGLTPGGAVALLVASDRGDTPIPVGACAGVVSQLGDLRLATRINADDGGRVALSPDLGAPACGAWVQALDMTTCAASDAVEVPVGGDCAFGLTAPLEDDSNHLRDFLLGIPVEVEADMMVYGLGLDSREADDAVKMGLYTDLGMLPRDLVVDGEGTTIVGPMELVTDPTFVEAGTYWVTAVFDDFASVGIGRPYVTHAYVELPFGEPLPAVFGAADWYEAEALNYWVVGECL